MSSSLYGPRPPMPASTEPPQATNIAVSSRLVRLDPGLFSLSLLPGPTDPGRGLPAVRVSLPPGPPGRREAVSINAFRGDGWMSVTDEATLLRVLAGGAEVLVTLYWSATDAGTSPPPLKLVRLNPEAAPGGPNDTPGAAAGAGMQGAAQRHDSPGPFPGTQAVPHGAEVVAHIEGVGDVDGKFGEWVGMRGGGRAIEGFSLTPRQGILPEDFEIRAVLGRDWYSPWLPGGSFCGSRGLALPLRGFSMRLHPTAAVRFELACCARFIDGSDVGPVGADRLCVSPSMAALEAFQVQLRPRGA
jgi:hypothetical protein